MHTYIILYYIIYKVTIYAATHTTRTRSPPRVYYTVPAGYDRAAGVIVW